MDKEQVLDHFGSGVAVAKLLGINNSCISRWDEIPLNHQRTLQRLSKGKLKAVEPPKKEKEPVVRVCYNLPKSVHDKFRKQCRKEKKPMTRMAIKLIQDYIDN